MYSSLLVRLSSRVDTDREINDAHSARRTHLLIDFSGENGERFILVRLKCVELNSSKS